ncbi:MAG TPA: DNA-binding protein, partial [Mycobacterium sp.]|nr:DNA-binding protein [Mycobacterium sp.]
MTKLSTATRRLRTGRPSRSDRLSHTLLPKRIALPVFASDAMSSVAYAPEEIFLMLSVAGLAAYSMAPWIALAVAAVLLVVVS